MRHGLCLRTLNHTLESEAPHDGAKLGAHAQSQAPAIGRGRQAIYTTGLTRRSHLRGRTATMARVGFADHAMQAARKESWQALEAGLLRHRPQQPGSWSRTARNHVFGISTARSSQHASRAQRPGMPTATGSPSSSRHSCSQSQALRAAAATAAAQRRQLIARQGGVEGEAAAAGAVVVARHGWRWRWWRVVATSLAVASQLLKVVARQEVVEVAAGSSRARVRARCGRRQRRGRRRG